MLSRQHPYRMGGVEALYVASCMLITLTVDGRCGLPGFCPSCTGADDANRGGVVLQVDTFTTVLSTPDKAA
jgi:hypothetical protein